MGFQNQGAATNPANQGGNWWQWFFKVLRSFVYNMGQQPGANGARGLGNTTVNHGLVGLGADNNKFMKHMVLSGREYHEAFALWQDQQERYRYMGMVGGQQGGGMGIGMGGHQGHHGHGSVNANMAQHALEAAGLLSDGDPRLEEKLALVIEEEHPAAHGVEERSSCREQRQRRHAGER